MSDVTVLLQAASRGNTDALNRLMPLVYDELRSLARAKLRMERAGHTLNATALVNEAYLKLVDQERVEWRSRRHFFSIASQAMRRILMDYAEARNAQKRGAGAKHVSLEAAREVFSEVQAREFLDLNQALDGLAEFNPRGAEVVQYRFFAGLSYDEIAGIMDLSSITVRRAWKVARVWLRRELGDDIADSTTRSLGVSPDSE